MTERSHGKERSAGAAHSQPFFGKGERAMGRKGEQFAGQTVALVTPFKDDGAVDYPALEKLVEWHVAEGTDGLAPMTINSPG